MKHVCPRTSAALRRVAFSGACLAALSVPAAAWAFALDADGDGVPDAADAYPCDPNAVGTAFAPAQGEHGMLLFEDQWPESESDLDFNDVALAYNYVYRLDPMGRVLSLRLTLNPLAVGGLYDHAIGLHLPVPRSSVYRITRTIGGGEIQDLSASDADAELVVKLITSVRQLFGGRQAQINSLPTQASIPGAPMEVEIKFHPAVELAIGGAPYDIFISRKRGHEIHRPEFSGTAEMDRTLFGTGRDGSSDSRWFVDRQGLPYALVMPALVRYPLEATSISALYPDIVEFARSGGTTHQDFYATRIQAAAAYHDVAGLGAPAPRFLGPDHVPAETACIREWGLAVDFGRSRNQFALASTTDRNGDVIVVGYVKGALPGQSAGGGLDVMFAKYDGATGAEVWARQIGGRGDELARDVVADAAGNLYIAGESESSLLGQGNSGQTDAFVMSVDAAGSVRWLRSLGGLGDDAARGVALDGDGNVVIGGGSTSRAIAGAADPGNAPSSFLAKYDADGSRLWLRQYRTDLADDSNYNFTLDVAVDPTSGAIYAVGAERRYGVDRGAAENAFVARHAADGSLSFVRHLGGHGYHRSGADQRYAFAYGVAVDAFDGAVYAIGHWYGGAGVSSWGEWPRAQGDVSADAFLIELGPTGDEHWTRIIASVDGGDDFGEAVHADGVGGSVYVTGRTNGTLPGQRSQGGYDYYVAAFGHDGRQRWIVQDGTSAMDVGHVAAALLLSQNGGELLITGNTAGALGSDAGAQLDIAVYRHDLSNGLRTGLTVANTVGWRLGDWSACSSACGGGSKSRAVECARVDGTAVAEAYCVEARPDATGYCEDYSGCEFDWATTAWSACSATCGSGVQRRIVSCERSDGSEIGPESFCSGARPAESRACNATAGCDYGWAAGEWSDCSADCGGGVQTRAVRCLRSADGLSVADGECAMLGAAPSAVRGCNTAGCGAGATTCATLRAGGSSASGVYSIDPDGAGGADAIEAWCDMTAHGGGWTNVDFAASRLRLANGHFLQCRGGLEQTEDALTCRGPLFDDDDRGWPYLFACAGTDRSAAYLLDHVAPSVGHARSDGLGFASVEARWDGSGTPGDGGTELCYVNGDLAHFASPACAAYAVGGNGNCVPSYITFRR